MELAVALLTALVFTSRARRSSSLNFEEDLDDPLDSVLRTSKIQLDADETASPAEKSQRDEIPVPEPLGNGVCAKTIPPRPPFATSTAPQPAWLQHPLYYKKLPELLKQYDAETLRSKLLDADSAKRRAMQLLHKIECENETLRVRCADLERVERRNEANAAAAVGAAGGDYSFGGLMNYFVLPGLKSKRRMTWKAV